MTVAGRRTKGIVMAVDAIAMEGRFRAREGLVGIVGMGYVGLPLMLAATRAGFRVLGFDVDEPKVGALNHGKSPLKHVGDGAHRRGARAGPASRPPPTSGGSASRTPS